MTNNVNFDQNNIEGFGQAISGLEVDTHKFLAVMPFARLMNLVTNPLAAANSKFRQTSSQLEDYFSLHSEIQRAFDTGKKQNAESYGRYVIRLSEGDNGDTPTIDLYCPEKMPVLPAATPDQKSRLIWPYGWIVVPYDGETQLAARFLAAQEKPATKDLQCVVTITHGKSVEYARQCFHDRNAYQRKASVGVAMAMDSRDPIVGIVRAIEERVPSADGKIMWRSRQMPQKGRDYIAAASFLRTSVICMAHGISGVQMTKASMPEKLSGEQFTNRAVIWYSKVIERLGEYMLDRENYVASSPAIWAALGALGKPLVDTPAQSDVDLEAMAAGLIAGLNDVNWRKSENWIGIAVKQSPSGFSFAGGAKDSGSAALKALSDPESDGFKQVRKSLTAAAA